MARILPGNWKTPNATPRAARVAETLTVLERNLPKHITVFHGVHWSRLDNGLAGIGDIDFIALSAQGSLLLVEQKSGWLSETEQGLAKRYRGKTVTIQVHLDQTIAALRHRLKPLNLQSDVAISYLLFCPDYTIKSAATAGLDELQIVDSQSRGELSSRIVSLLDSLDRQAQDSGSDAPRLHRFLANELELVPDASALVGRANELFTRMSDGLATWARRFDISPFRLRVTATAGSGKTQLALALIAQAHDEDRRVLYVCFNRPLADHIHAAVPDGALVYTYHQWCQHRIRAANEPIDFSQPAVFDWLAERSAQLELTDADATDCLIIDEGQDFSPQWRDDLFRCVSKPGGQIWWLEDPMQNLYDRPVAAPHDWPKLSAMVNYRSPHAIVDFLNRHLMIDHQIQGAGPMVGREIECLTYRDAEGLQTQTKQAISFALRAGFRREDIVVITMVGIARSTLLNRPALGPHRFKAFRGKYDLFGNPEYTDGDVLIDTVYRFKGQSAPCIILTELDFETLDDAARRKLFVGMTRASMHLLLVMTERAARGLGISPTRGAGDDSGADDSSQSVTSA
ncbi:MAG: ATP-binding domain-containing protein [Burkholderiaceae bacterium]